MKKIKIALLSIVLLFSTSIYAKCGKSYFTMNMFGSTFMASVETTPTDIGTMYGIITPSFGIMMTLRDMRDFVKGTNELRRLFRQTVRRARNGELRGFNEDMVIRFPIVAPFSTERRNSLTAAELRARIAVDNNGTPSAIIHTKEDAYGDIAFIILFHSVESIDDMLNAINERIAEDLSY